MGPMDSDQWRRRQRCTVKCMQSMAGHGHKMALGLCVCVCMGAGVAPQ